MTDDLLSSLTARERAELETDIDWLIEHPEGRMGAKYHDAGSCWRLIAALLAEIRRLRADR